MSEQVFTVPYRLGDKARLFDVGQGIHSTVSLILKRGGGKVMSFTDTLRRMKWYVILFGLLAALQIGIMIYNGGSTAPELLLTCVCLLFGGTIFSTWQKNRKSFARTLEKYLEGEEQGGTIVIDGKGITERSDTGGETRFVWDEYRHCIISDEVIVLTSLRPVMVIVRYSEETEQGLRQALAAFEREKSIYTVEIKGKKK